MSKFNFHVATGGYTMPPEIQANEDNELLMPTGFQGETQAPAGLPQRKYADDPELLLPGGTFRIQPANGREE